MEFNNVMVVVKNQNDITPTEESIIRILMGHNIQYTVMQIDTLFKEDDVFAKVVIAAPYNEDSIVGYMASRFGDGLIAVGANIGSYASFIVTATGGYIISATSLDNIAERVLDRIQLLSTGVPKKSLDAVMSRYLSTDYEAPRYKEIKDLEGKPTSQVYYDLVLKLAGKPKGADIKLTEEQVKKYKDCVTPTICEAHHVDYNDVHARAWLAYKLLSADI